MCILTIIAFQISLVMLIYTNHFIFSIALLTFPVGEYIICNNKVLYFIINFLQKENYHEKIPD